MEQTQSQSKSEFKYRNMNVALNFVSINLTYYILNFIE